MSIHPDAEASRKPVDRTLEAGVVECHQPSALSTDQVMVMLTGCEDALEARQPLPNRHPLHEAVLDYGMPFLTRPLAIARAALTADAGVLGAAAVGLMG